jgi:hypothetical protein
MPNYTWLNLPVSKMLLRKGDLAYAWWVNQKGDPEFIRVKTSVGHVRAGFQRVRTNQKRPKSLLHRSESDSSLENRSYVVSRKPTFLYSVTIHIIIIHIYHHTHTSSYIASSYHASYMHGYTGLCCRHRFSKRVIQIFNSQTWLDFHYGYHNQYWMIEVFKAPSE